MPPGAFGYSIGGIHELQPVPDDLLLALNPQWHVVVGSPEHPKAIAETTARVQHVRALLPDCCIGVRWLEDNKLMLDLWRRAGGDVERAADDYAARYFPLAIPGTWLMVSNEDDSSASDPHVFATVVQMYLAITRRATAQRLPLGIACVPMGEPPYGQYEMLAPLFVLMQQARRQTLPVVHILRPNAYFPTHPDPDTRQSLIVHLAQRHQREMRHVALAAGVDLGPLALGEYNTVKSLAAALDGPMDMDLSATAWMDFLLEAAVDDPFAIFCYGDGRYTDTRWRSFNLARDPAFTDQMIARLPRRRLPLIQDWSQRVATKKYMPRLICPHLNTGNGRLTGMGDGELVQCVLAPDGWVDQRKNGQREGKKVADGYVWFGDDTSELYTPDGLQHGTFYVQYSKPPDNAQDLRYYGARWAPEWMAKGESFDRAVWLVKYTWDLKVVASYEHRTTLVFKDWHDSFTTINGVTLRNVAILSWSGEEEWAFAEDYGLVEWHNLVTGAKSSLLTVGGPKPPLPAQPAIKRPVVAAPPNYPTTPPPVVLPYPIVDATQYGVAVAGVVTSMPELSANVRTQPDTSAPIAGQVIVGTEVKVRPKLYPPDGSTNDGFKWQSLTQPVVGWVFNGVKISTDGAADPWLLELAVPYVSQRDVDADRYNNDCGIASLLMLTRFAHWLRTGRTPKRPRVDDLVDDTPLATQKYLNFDNLDALAALLGYDTRYLRPLDNAGIVQQLAVSLPPIICVDYSILFPGQPRIAHLLPVIGYSARRFKLHDPYLMGPNVAVDAQRVADAMRVVPDNAFGFQGMVLLE